MNVASRSLLRGLISDVMSEIRAIGKGHSMSDYTSYLFARPSFLEGLARIFDLGGTLNEYNTSPSPQEADRIAMQNDWKVIGEDMRQAISQFERENNIKLKR